MSTVNTTDSAPTTANGNSSGNNGSDNNNSSDRNRSNGRGAGNNRTHNQRPSRGVSTDNLCNFKGTIKSLRVLGTKVEKQSQDFSKFTTALDNYVLSSFVYPKDILFVVTDCKDSMCIIAADFPSKVKLVKDIYLEYMDEDDGTDDDKALAKTHNIALDDDMSYLYKAVFTEFNKPKTFAASNMAALWGVIIGQCAGPLQQQVKAKGEYESHLHNPVWLLQTIKKVILGVIQQSNIYHSTFHALKDLYKMRQKSDEIVEEYYHRFEAVINLVNLSNDTKVFNKKGLLSLEVANDPKVTASNVNQWFLAMMFIENTCTMYQYHISQLHNFSFNQDHHLGGIPISVLILDTGSTFNSFFNRQFLEKIQTCDGIQAYYNRGHMDYNKAIIVSPTST